MNNIKQPPASVPVSHAEKSGPSRAIVQESEKASRSAAETSTVMLGTITQRLLRESIALLYILNEVPTAVVENSGPDHLSKQIASATRLLSLAREKELVETLAFLAAADGDPRKVTALCVEQNADHKCLSIKVAANHGALLGLKRGFDNIAGILERIARQGKSFSRIITVRHRGTNPLTLSSGRANP